MSKICDVHCKSLTFGWISLSLYKFVVYYSNIHIFDQDFTLEWSWHGKMVTCGVLYNSSRIKISRLTESSHSKHQQCAIDMDCADFRTKIGTHLLYKTQPFLEYLFINSHPVNAIYILCKSFILVIGHIDHCRHCRSPFFWVLPIDWLCLGRQTELIQSDLHIVLALMDPFIETQQSASTITAVVSEWITLSH